MSPFFGLKFGNIIMGTGKMKWDKNIFNNNFNVNNVNFKETGMGTAFISFKGFRNSEANDTELEQSLVIGRIVFRSIIEAMQNERPENQRWTGSLDSIYGIKYLEVGGATEEGFGYGSAFLKAIKQLQNNGPPSYYLNRDLHLFYEQLEILEKAYLSIRE